MELTIIVSIICIIMSGISCLVGVLALAKVIGMEKSTHSVQLMPVDPEIDRLNKKYVDEWATSEKSIEKEMNMYREDVEDNLSQFSTSEEDKEVFSL